MKEVELKISDEQVDGVFAISLVDNPAIEEEFILLSKIDVQFKVIDELKREVVGLVLVPNKRILRMMNGEKFNIYFSAETIAQTQLLWMKNNYTKNATLDHEVKTDGVTFFESWIVEDEKNDKSNLYNLNAKKGSWVIKAKIENDEVLQGIKDGTYNGFSIEGKFDGLNELKKIELESYNDYPQGATDNAKIALRWAEENGWGSCGTDVGKARANQLANKEAISEDTISRMASFERHRQNSQKELGDGCGRLMWLAWGGDAGVEWAQRKLKQIRKQELSELDEGLELIKEFLKQI